MKRLNQPQPARVTLDSVRRPASVSWGARGAVRRAVVEHVLDCWYVDEGWWSDAPLRRMYYECQLAGGVRLIVVYDLITQRWFVQR